MTADEANKIIADYMGNARKENEKLYWYYNNKFTNSLDALIPVWNKMGDRFSMSYYRESRLYCDSFGIIHRFTFCDDFLSDKQPMVEDYDLTEAAAIATAKAIRGMNE